ncbi:MAG: hypothetical protein ACI8ZF_000743 [Candidatus Midichloriaceae bacterium]|jgi:hypothetical protein
MSRQGTMMRSVKSLHERRVTQSNRKDISLICSANKPIAKLVPYKPSSTQRKPGHLKGLIHIEKDFDK